MIGRHKTLWSALLSERSKNSQIAIAAKILKIPANRDTAQIYRIDRDPAHDIIELVEAEHCRRERRCEDHYSSWLEICRCAFGLARHFFRSQLIGYLDAKRYDKERRHHAKQDVDRKC